jgi:glycosyltransferase involved in cell wall biosynthesis
MAEALSSGLPVLAADTPVTREICGDAALYFRSFSSRELHDRLIDLDRHRGLRASLFEQSRERAGRLYRWSDHVDRLLELFESLMQRRRSGLTA